MTTPSAARQIPGRSAIAGKAKARQSLRTRLAVWNAAVVILTAVTTLIILRQGVTWALNREIDEILKEDVAEISLMLSEIPTGNFDELKLELSRKAKGHRQHGWFVELRGEGRKQLWWSRGEDSETPGEQEPRTRRPPLQ